MDYTLKLLLLLSSLLHLSPVPQRGTVAILGGGTPIQTFTHIQSCTADNAGSVTPQTCTWGTGNTGAHHLLRLCVTVFGADTITGWSGDTGILVTDLNALQFNSLPTVTCVYILNAVGGSSAEQVSCSATCYQPMMTGDEWSSNLPFAFDKCDAGATGASGTSASSVAITPKNGHSLLIGNVTVYSGTLTATGSWNTYANNSSTHEQQLLGQVQNPAASVAATATVSNNFAWAAHVCSFTH